MFSIGFLAFMKLSDPVDLYTVSLCPSRTVHCILGPKNPGQILCQKSGRKPEGEGGI